MFNLKFIKYIAAATAMLAAFYFTYSQGYKSGENNQVIICNEKVNNINNAYELAKQNAMQDAKKARQQAVNSAKEYWQKNAEQKIVTQTIEKEVIKYVKAESNSDDVCVLNDDFVRVWNAAAKGANTASAGKY